MNIIIRPGRSVPQDHIEWLVARYGWRRTALAILSHALRRRGLGLKPEPSPRLGKEPQCDRLRRDIGLPPEPRGLRYWDLR